MAIFESNSNTVFVKVTAQELRAGKKILVVILNDDNLKIESEISSNFRAGDNKKNDFLANSGDAWLSVGNWN